MVDFLGAWAGFQRKGRIYFVSFGTKEFLERGRQLTDRKNAQKEGLSLPAARGHAARLFPSFKTMLFWLTLKGLRVFSLGLRSSCICLCTHFTYNAVLKARLNFYLYFCNRTHLCNHNTTQVRVSATP